ncbi:hypothetical protein F4604DRAFT_1682342 [Suillus subluteus]|nr:hypothetical protein F4604DRAFT_1682342 [Suillus subluteus]
MPEVANDTLNATLVTLQSLIKCCIQLKEGNPEALKLSDEIARGVAKDLKLYGGHATSFSPQLLSCAAIVRQYSKGGAFQTIPDWKSVVDNDPCIKSHPRFHKTVDYCPLAANATHAIMDIEATGLSSNIQPPTVLAANNAYTEQAPAVSADAIPPSPLPASLALEPLTPLPPSVAPTAPVTTKYTLFVPGNLNKAQSVARPSKKRKAEPDVTDLEDAPWTALLKELQRQVHQILLVHPPYTRSLTKPKALDPTGPDTPDAAADNGFWDTDTKPSGWGEDEIIATAVEHSIHYHPRRCNKCAKLGIPCIVLLDKKFGRTRLVCANCDKTKVSCAINGVGVQDRLKAEATAKVAARAANPPKHSWSLTFVKQETAEHEAAEEQPMELALAPMDAMPITTMPPSGPINDLEQGRRPTSNPPVEPEPTARDILQAIQDLGGKFDLLATNERVDTLDAKVDLVEEVHGHQLASLEQHINASDAQWKVMSSSLGHLTNCLWDHKDDMGAHQPRVNTTNYAPPRHSSEKLPVWLNGASSVEDIGISTIGKQWTHAWDPSVVTGVQDEVETSASATRNGDAPDSPVLRADSITSSRLSSTPSAISDK